MRRRRTAAPSEDLVNETEPSTDTVMSTETTSSTDTQVSPEATPAEPGAATDTVTLEASASEAPVITEAPVKPRRGRRPKAAEANAEPAPVEASLFEATEGEVVEAAPEKPRRTRRPRKAVEAVATEEASESATESSEAVEALPPVDPAFGPIDIDPGFAPTDPIAEGILPTEEGDSVTEGTDEGETSAPESLVPTAEADSETESASDDTGDAATDTTGDTVEEEATELVADATQPASARSSRNRRDRRNRRGRADAATAPNNELAPEVLVAPVGPVRKRGPRTLAITLPLPSVPVDIAPEAAVNPVVGSAPVRRGTRTVPVTRRILTPSGVAVIPAEQAAALLAGSIVPIEKIGESGETISLPIPVLPLALAEPKYQPLPAETLERLPEVRVVQTNGVPELTINGIPSLPAFLFVNTEVADEPEVALEIAAKQIRLAYDSGVRLFTLLAHLPWKRKTGERRFDSLDNVLGLVAANAPDALVLPRLIFSPPASWERANPDEMTLYADGETGDVSIASAPFWKEEAVAALRAAIEHLAESENASRVLGCYLEHGEWFQTKGTGPDRSVANTNAFRNWLKKQYHSNEVALRAAWYDGSVAFETAEIPGNDAFAAIADTSPTLPVFFSEREQRVADFYAYTSDITAQTITGLASIAKEASGGRLAVAVSYGYTLEIARPGSGHYALADVLASPDIDIITAPISYAGRTPGGSAPMPVPVDSVLLAGKLFVSEDDTKTHLALRETEDNYNPKVATPEATRAIHARNLGAAVAKGCGISWMDLWGEGWLGDEAIWNDLGRLTRFAGTLAERRRESSTSVAAPDVAVIIDERGLFDIRGGEEPALLATLIGRHRDTFARSGARVGYYLMSDLLKPEFPETPRLFLFVNAFRIPLEIRSAIKNRFQNDGRTLAWLFTPGARETGNIAELADVIGMQLRLQPWGSRTGTQITEGRSPVTENARGERFGEERRTNPSFTVADPKAQVLGEYISSGNPSLALRKHPRWQSVFIGERELPLPLLRGIYKLAGVPVVTPEEDCIHTASDGFVALHSAMGSTATVYAPRRDAEVAVYDALNDELVAGAGYGARVNVEIRGTRLLLLAAPEELTARFGVSPEALAEATPGLTREELPAAPAAFVFETVPSVEPLPTALPQRGAPPQNRRQQPTGLGNLPPVELSVSAEDIALFEAALAGEIALLDKEDDDAALLLPLSPEEAAAAGNRKKRRRRRRRGNRGEETELTGETEAGTEEDADETEESEDEWDQAEAALRTEAVFELADLTLSATERTFDADALLPLTEEGEEVAPIFEAPTLNADNTDPVAEMLARIFTVPAVVETEPQVEAEAPVSAGPRRPSLDELLPLSELPSDMELPPIPDELLPLVTDTRENEATEQEEGTNPSEAPQGLLSSVARRRRGTSSGEGGFASRLRRRAANRAESTPDSEPTAPEPTDSTDSEGDS